MEQRPNASRRRTPARRGVVAGDDRRARPPGRPRSRAGATAGTGTVNRAARTTTGHDARVRWHAAERRAVHLASLLREKGVVREPTRPSGRRDGRFGSAALDEARVIAAEWNVDRSPRQPLDR